MRRSGYGIFSFISLSCSATLPMRSSRSGIFSCMSLSCSATSASNDSNRIMHVCRQRSPLPLRSFIWSSIAFIFVFMFSSFRSNTSRSRASVSVFSLSCFADIAFTISLKSPASRCAQSGTIRALVPATNRSVSSFIALASLRIWASQSLTSLYCEIFWLIDSEIVSKLFLSAHCPSSSLQMADHSGARRVDAPPSRASIASDTISGEKC